MNLFSRMSLKARIQLGFAAVAGVLVLALAFFAQAQFKLGALERESVRRFADATTLNEVAQRVIGVSALFGDAEVNRNFPASEKAFREAHASAEADVKLVAGIVDTDEERAKVEEFGRSYRAYLAIFDNDLAPVLKAAGSDATEKIRAVDEKLDQAREHALQPLKAIEESVEAEARHEQQLFEETFRRGLWLGGVFGLAGLLAAALISYFLAERIARVLRASIDTLTGTVRQMADASQALAAASQQLAQSNSEQAAALQETSASIEEINAMIGKSAGNAQESESFAHSSAEAAGGGRETAQRTLTTMQQISETNDRILRQIEETNTSISSITRLITEIGDKTKVINDIVFQTKLLSFNASVEAARAGEHGKGFAVVAEEVGNLARMSGSAATEINAMLESSVAKVEAVAREMQSRAEKLIREGREMVAAGMGSAQDSGKALEEIAEKASSVARIVAEISTAMKEQAQGAAEITKAMGQLDQVTQQNTTVSQQVASSASRLTDDSQRLTQIVEELRVLAYGA